MENPFYWNRRSFIQHVASTCAGAFLLGRSGVSNDCQPDEASQLPWSPQGLCGYGNMLTPSISPDPCHMILNCDMGGAYFSRDAGQSWQLIDFRVLEGSPLVRPAFHPHYLQNSTFYAVSGRWSDLREITVKANGGFEHQLLSQRGNPFNGKRLQGAIAINPHDPKVMLVGVTDESSFSGYGLFSSPDRCQGIPLNAGSGYPVINEIWRTEDGGRNWTQVRNLGDSGFVLEFHFDRSIRGRVFAATQRYLFISQDGGSTWDDFHAPNDSRDCTDLIRSFAGASNDNELFLYCVIRNRDPGGDLRDVGLYVSRNLEPWKPMLTNGMEHALAGDCDGESWCCNDLQFHHVMSSNDDCQTVYAVNANTGYFDKGKHCAVYRSTDAGNQWEMTFLPKPFKSSGLPPLRTVDLNWESVRTEADRLEPCNAIAVCPTDASRALKVGTRSYVLDETYWHCADSQPRRQDDSDQEVSWTCNGLNVTTAWHYYINPTDPDRHFIAYTDCNYARSNDRGQSWVWGQFDSAGLENWQNTVYEFAFDPEDGSRMWGAFSSLHDIPTGNVVLSYQEAADKKDEIGRVGFSQDFGQTWEYDIASRGLRQVDDGRIRPVTSVVYAEQQKVLYASVYDDGIYRADDVGADEFHWECISEDLDSLTNRRFFRVIAHDDGTLFAMVSARSTRDDKDKPVFGQNNDGVGIYRLSMGQVEWQLLGDMQPSRLEWVRDFAVDPHDSSRIYVAVSQPSDKLEEGDEYQSGVYQLDEVSRRWQQLPLDGMPQSFRHAGVTVDPQDSNRIFVSLAGDIGGRPSRKHEGLWLCNSDGTECKPFSALPFKHVLRVSFDSKDPEYLRVCTFGAGVWKGKVNPQ